MIVTLHRTAIVENLPPHFEVEIEEGATFGDLIDLLDQKYGAIKEKILDQGCLKEGALVLVNGISILKLAGSGLILRDGDDILLSVTVIGG